MGECLVFLIQKKEIRFIFRNTKSPGTEVSKTEPLSKTLPEG